MKQITQRKDISDSLCIDSHYIENRIDYMKRSTRSSLLRKELFKKEDQEMKEQAQTESKKHEKSAEESAQTLLYDYIAHKTLDQQKSIFRTFTTMKKNQKQVKNVVHEQKVNNIVDSFVKKIKMNNPYSQTVHYQPFDQNIEKENEDERQGITVNPILLNIILTFSILHTLTTCIIATLSLVFKEIVRDEWINVFDIASVIWMLFEMFLGFTRKTFVGGVKLKKLSEISNNYLSRQFIIDVICTSVLLFDFIAHVWFKRFLGLFFLLKLSDVGEKLNWLEIKLLDTTYKEHWWELVKIFMQNFLFAHLLAVVLIMMSWIDEEQSWLHKIGASTAPWYERYCWSYYGGTTIMLTVGFGDIAAGNYKQALCLTFIETLSCISLAYNIHCVGTLISNIRNEENDKNKKIKLLRNLSEKNNISHDLTAKINNYILEASIIKKKFNFEEDKNFIDNLPGSLKSDFLRESHKKIFNFIPFFQNLTDKTLVKLAQKVDIMIAHPEQVIFKKNEWNTIAILKNGSVGFCTKMKDSKFNGIVIDKIKVKQKEDPKLISLEFICPQNLKNYEIKSKQYSILFLIEILDFLDVIKDSEYDFQYFHEKKDLEKRNLGEYELFNCEHCKEKHSKFKCSKLHFVPLTQKIVNKYLYNQKNGKNKRKKNSRVNKSSHHDCGSYKPLKGYQIINTMMREAGFSTMCMNSSAQIFLNSQTLNQKQNFETSRSESLKHLILAQMQLKQKEFWKVESDKLNDYKFYFPVQNPKNLRNNYQQMKKRKILRNNLKKYTL